MRAPKRSAAWMSAALLLTLIACAGCADRSLTTPSITAAASGGDPTVTATAPDSATQDTTLDVTVNGSNFDAGSVAEWAIDGVAAVKVHTNSTRFVNSRRLIANITIAVDADPVLYDVIVTAATGKKGIGTELFAVKRKATDTPIVATYRDAAGDGVRSDGAAYTDGVDGVSALILAIGNYRVEALNGTSTRMFCFDFHGQSTGGLLPNAFCDHGYQTTGTPDVAGGWLMLAPGASMTTQSQVTWVQNGSNWFLRFGWDCSQAKVPATRATVTRSADGGTWTLESPSGTAFLCRSAVKGKPGTGFAAQVVMPFAVVVQVKP
jgi:hypothetical protein